MTYVIASGCCNEASCIPVCPVDCIRPRPGDPEFLAAEQLYIDPTSCTDCAACLTECPVGAIHDEWELPESLSVFKEINAEYFEENPLVVTRSERTAKPKLPAERPVLRVAVIGAGPSGCYAVDDLSRIAGVEVSVFDRLPTPYGLVRAGVAPDHQSTKRVADGFQQVLKRKNVACYFNVEIGRDITVDELFEKHHAVIFSGGAAGDRRLGIAGEDLPGSSSAREFVAWYNGHPDHAASQFDLSGERVVIVGNGNVALDVARVLASPADAFDATDMAAYAVDALRASGVREIVVAARRAVDDAAYTTSEFLALTEADEFEVATRREELEAGSPSSAVRYGGARRRALAAAAATDVPVGDGRRRISFRYLMTPVEIEGDGAVERVRFAHAGNGAEEIIETGLVLRAIGYRGVAVPGIPFDESLGRIPHADGRVLDAPGGATVGGLYCTGWAKRGPSGVIGTNKVCSAETVATVFADHSAGLLPEPLGLKADLREEVEELLRSRAVDVVDFAGWLRIDAAEKLRGEQAAVVRPRLKLHDVTDLLATAYAAG